jgi:hypothetical protein
MGELYSLSRYMQPQALKERGLSHFDSWRQAFADTKTDIEQTAAGGYEPVTRLAKFVNMPELYKMVGSNMDVVTSEQLAQYVTRPELEGGKRNFHLAPRTPRLERFQEDLGARVQAIRARRGPPSKGDDILLSVIGDGRKGAIDMRLVDPSAPNDPNSKLNQMIDNVHRIWEETKNQPFYDPATGYKTEVMRGPATQMVFSNLGIKGGEGRFSAYDAMRREWIRRGIPANEIAFIKDYTTPTAKQRLLNDVNDGKVRILVGSTQKMGTGINAQKRLIAIHNLDPLWFPADDEQRNGRGLRQGNLNPRLQIHDYSTKGTYDSTMWAMMARKGRFIEQFFRGDPNLREMEDLGEASQYEQAAAMATSDERVIKLVEMRQELQKLERREQAHRNEQFTLEYREREALREVERETKSVAQSQDAIARAQDISGNKFTMKVGRRTYTDRKEAAEAIAKTIADNYPSMQLDESRPVGEIGGFPLSMEPSHTVEDGKWVKGSTPILRIHFAEDWQTSLGSASGPGVIASASAYIKDLPEYLAMHERRRDDAQARAESNRRAMGKPFTEGEKIEPLRRQIRDFEAALSAAPIEKTSMGVPGQEITLSDSGRMGAPEQMGPTAGRFGLAEGEGASGTAPQTFRDLREDYDRFRRSDVAEPHQAAHAWTRARGAETGFEHLVALGRGNSVDHAGTSDKPNGVILPPDIMDRLDDPDAVMVLHHNHPKNFGPSQTDVAILAAQGVRAIVVHTHDGDAFSVSLTEDYRQALDTLDPLQAYQALSGAYAKVGEVVRDRLQKFVDNRVISAELAGRLYADLVNRALNAARVTEYISSRSSPLNAGLLKSLLRDAAIALRGDLTPAMERDLNGRIAQSTLTVRPDEAMGRLARRTEDAMAAGRPVGPGGDQRGRGRTSEAAAQARSLAEDRPPDFTPPGAPTRAEVKADLSRVVYRDARTLRERARDYVNDLRTDWSDNFKQGFLDDTTGAARFETSVSEGKLLPAGQSPTWQLRLTRNVPAMMSVVMGMRRRDGTYAGGALQYGDEGVFQVIPGSKPFAEVFKPIFDAQNEDTWAAWAIANRAKRLRAEGREKLVSDEFIDRYADVDKAYEQADGTNPFREAMDGWRALAKAALDTAEDRGLINAEQRALWERDDYVPFYRHRDEGPSGPGPGGRATRHIRSGIRRLKGGESQLNDLYDNMMTHLTALYGRSLENHAKTMMVDLAAGTEAMTPASVTARERIETPEGRARLEEMGLDPDQMDAAAKEAARSLWGMIKNEDPSLISIMRDGKPEFYQVNDPLLLRSMASVGPEAMHGLIYNFFRGAKQVLSKSVTIDPGYMARNLMRDTAQTAVLTGSGGLSTVRGFVESLNNSPAQLAIMAGGAGGSYFYNTKPGQARRMLSKEQARGVIDTPRKALAALEHLGVASENANRLALYNAVKARGGTEADAITAAQDLLPFSQRGDHIAMRTLIDTVPFFNARVQGLYRLYRGARETPTAFLVRGGIMTAAALALWAANQDDERYQALEDWDKQSYFHFFLGDGSEWWHHLRLPSPFETGAVFAKIPEMLMDYAKDGRTKQLRDAFLSNLTSQLQLSPIPQLLHPLLDVYANKEHFTGRPIVSAREEHLLPEEQYGPRTSQAMIALGQTFGVSPDQAQALVRGYGGTVATYLLAASDALAEATGLTKPSATKRLDQMPIVASFVRQEPAMSTRWMQEFYEMKKEVDQVHATIQKFRKEGDTQGVKRLVEAHPAALSTYPAAAKIGEHLGKMRQAMAQVNASTTLTPDQKRQRLDVLMAQINRVAAQTAPLVRRYESQP